ncbi:MAG: hypothetical protein AAFV69_05020 [Pseudomonadota bacterium]
MTIDRFWNALGAAAFFVAAGFLTTSMSIAAIQAASFSSGPSCHATGCYTVASR